MGLLIEFFEAFDCVNPEILVHKLGENVVDWLSGILVLDESYNLRQWYWCTSSKFNHLFGYVVNSYSNIRENEQSKRLEPNVEIRKQNHGKMFQVEGVHR